MPITTTWSPATIARAAQAEELKPARVSELLSALTPSEFRGLVDFASNEANAGVDQKAWVAGFPNVLGSLKANEQGAIIRVAVTVAGGVAR